MMWDCWDSSISKPQFLAQRREALVKLFPCVNCKAEPGSECKHDSGCVDSDRRPIERPADPARVQLDES